MPGSYNLINCTFFLSLLHNKSWHEPRIVVKSTNKSQCVMTFELEGLHEGKRRACTYVCVLNERRRKEKKIGKTSIICIDSHEKPIQFIQVEKQIYAYAHAVE